MGPTATGTSRSAEPRTRARLCGPLALEVDGRDATQQLRGHQARVLAAYLIAHRERAVGRAELIAILWPEHAPKDPSADLRSLLTSLRRAVGADALAGKEHLRLELPEPVWVDAEAAYAGISAARAAARGGDWPVAREEARSALELLDAGFLPDAEAAWIDARRQEAEDMRMEALEWVAQASLALGEPELTAAEWAARELIASSPYRETGYRYLMQALAAEGNPAEALRVYDEIRVLLRDELGTAPAPGLQALHAQLLGAEPTVASGPAPAAQPPAVPGGHLTAEGERKQVTVLFVDVVGSMDLQQQMDVEEWRALMERFFQIMCAGVHRYGGTVDKFTGDGIMALFGAPIAAEDHAVRACHAALRSQRDLAEFAAGLRRRRGLSISVRMGLNSGDVVVGAIGADLAMTYTAVGYTVGLAQRLQELAAPECIYVSGHTESLVEGYFELADLGEFLVKGASAPLRVHELIKAGAARGRLDVARRWGLSRFVGRDDELTYLMTSVEKALSVPGHVIGIVGEAGVGKSRLCLELVEHCRGRGTPVYHVTAQAHAASVPFMPLLRLLRDYFEITDSESDQASRERIAGRLVLLERSFEEDLPLLFDFLGVADRARPPQRMDPEARQRRLLALMKRITQAQGAKDPGVFVFEDLHWLDPATEVFLANHVETAQGMRGLTVLNYRPEYRAPWMARSYYRQIALPPLRDADVGAMIRELLGSDPTADPVAEMVRERGAGNPFFVEELIRTLVEAGELEGERGAYRLSRSVAQLSLPPTVQAVLGARIDRLGEREKGVLQAAAVIGREVPGPILGRVAGIGEAELDAALAELVAGEFVFEQTPYPETIHAFKHPLTQEVAYRSQLKERRARVHRAAAHAIAEHYADQLDERAALVAGHWEAAGEAAEAARWHARAATWAGFNDTSAALGHWRRVRALADEAGGADAATLGLVARVNVLNYGWRLGIAPEEAELAFRQAQAMAEEAGDVHTRVFLLAAYGAVKGFTEGDPRAHAELLRGAIALAEGSGDPNLFMVVAPFAIAFLYIGEYAEGVAILDRAIELAARDPEIGAGIVVGCPFGYCHAVKGGFLAYMGELAESRRLIEEGRRLCGEQGDLESVGWTHIWSVSLAFAEGHPGAAVEHAREALDIADRAGHRYSRALAWSMLAWAESLCGRWEDAIEAVEQGRAVRGEQFRSAEAVTVMLGVLGDAYRALGQLERAEALVREGYANSRAASLRFLEPMSGMLLARVLRASAGKEARAEIEAVLADVLRVVRETGARSFEPQVQVERAELARLLGDDEGRRQALATAYRQFDEIGATGHTARLDGALQTAAPSPRRLS